LPFCGCEIARRQARNGDALARDAHRYREAVTAFVSLPLVDALISDNYFCRLATTRFAGPSAMRTACATVRG
jgi:hypothetical protein